MQTLKLQGSCRGFDKLPDLSPGCLRAHCSLPQHGLSLTVGLLAGVVLFQHGGSVATCYLRDLGHMASPEFFFPPLKKGE